MLKDRKVLLVGAVQSLFEGAMYIFVLQVGYSPKPEALNPKAMYIFVLQVGLGFRASGFGLRA